MDDIEQEIDLDQITDESLLQSLVRLTLPTFLHFIVWENISETKAWPLSIYDNFFFFK